MWYICLKQTFELNLKTAVLYYKIALKMNVKNLVQMKTTHIID